MGEAAVMEKGPWEGPPPLSRPPSTERDGVMMAHEEAMTQGGEKMARLKVKVTKIESRRGQSGAYVVAHLAGGKRAYVWDRGLVQTLSTPGLYEVEAEERQGFLRITAARPIAAANGTRGHEERPGEASMASGGSQERMVALQAAVALAPHLGLRDIGQVVAIAERLMRWLLREG
jgi:hypothetical protein